MKKRQYAYWLLFCFVVLVVVPILIPSGDAGIYPTSILVSTGIMAMICVGISLLMGYAGQISLGHAAFYAIGSYTTAILGSRYEFSHNSAVWPWVWILAGIGFSCLVAFLIGVPSLRLRGHYLAMATLGFGVIVHEIAVARESAGGIYGFPDLSFFGLVIDTDARWYFLVWGTLCVLTLLSLHLIHSRAGRALRSIHGNELAARALGVNISFYKTQIFVLSAAMASLAGSYHAHHEIVVGSSSFGFQTSIVVVVMVVVGGMSNVWAALLGAVFISLLEEKLRAYPDWMTFIYGTILILVMIFAPRGIFLTLVSAARRGWARWVSAGEKKAVTTGVPGG